MHILLSHDDSIVGVGWQCHCGKQSCRSSNEYSMSLVHADFVFCTPFVFEWEQTDRQDE